MNFLQGKKLILVGIIVVLLSAIPLTVFFLQQNQDTRSRAQASTTLYFATPGVTTALTTPVQKAVGDTIPLDIIVDPGTNQISFIKMNISYDATKLTIDQANGIKQNDASFPSVLEGPTYTDGNINITLSIGADPTKVAQTPTRVATITFKAKESTNSTPTVVKFLDGQTQVLSIASSDQPSENVLASTKPANIAIGGSGTSPSTSPNPSPMTSGTPAPSTGTPTPAATNQPPSCTSLNLDRAPSGAAPFAVTFTAIGRDTDGTINKVTFNFGDGPVQDVTQSGGIGTNTVSAPVAHTYNNPGTYQASAIITDDKGAISTACPQTITVTAAQGGGAGGTNPGNPQPTIASSAATPTPPTTTLTALPLTGGGQPTPTMKPSGSGDTVLAGGVIAAVVSIVGALMFFSL